MENTGVVDVNVRSAREFINARPWEFWWHPCSHLMFVAFSLVIGKLYFLEDASRTYFECSWCVSTRAVPHEGQFLLLVVLLQLLSNSTPWRLVRVALRLSVVGVLSITAIDLFVITEFWVRFNAQYLIEFGSQLGALQSFFKEFFNSPWMWVTTACTVTLTTVTVVRYVHLDQQRVVPFSMYLFVCLAAYGCSLVEESEFHGEVLKNSVQVFFSPATHRRSYSEDFKQRATGIQHSQQECYEGQGNSSNVILIVVESLSAYHSALFSGIDDWTPEFDEISRGGMRFTSFYANGVNTEQGLVSLLTGEPPIPKPADGSLSVLDDFKDPPQSLPKVLHRSGYDTAFLTTGDLSFLKKGEWLEKIGFDLVEGHESSYYKGMKRYLFNAAPDDALYGRALDELKKPRSRPLFLSLETVTTHMPYVDPSSAAHSQEQTFRYADRQLGQFVHQLRSTGYFESGILIITGDHRAMVPMTERERSRYGDRAYIKVPLTVLGDGISAGEVQAGFSQSDLLPSLQYWLSKGQNCIQENRGIFLPTPTHPPSCIFSTRSYNTNDVFVQCGKSDYAVHLDGDQTNFAGASSGPSGLVNEVNSLRLGNGFW